MRNKQREGKKKKKKKEKKRKKKKTPPEEGTTDDKTSQPFESPCRPSSLLQKQPRPLLSDKK
jgi:hypothetical protein